MNADEFLSIVKSAARYAFADSGRIGNLLLTQSQDCSASNLREPEARHALVQVCEARRILYGIEVPTKGKYSFTGTNEIAARHDLVLYEDLPIRDVLVEFKAGQIHVTKNEAGERDAPKITKDLRKLIFEPDAPGACMFHILHRKGGKTIAKILWKYRIAWNSATAERACLPNRWFTLIILVRPIGTKPAVLHSTSAPLQELDPVTFFSEESLNNVELA